MKPTSILLAGKKRLAVGVTNRRFHRMINNALLAAVDSIAKSLISC